MRNLIGVAVLVLSFSQAALAQSDSQTFKITSPIAPLAQPILGPATNASHKSFDDPAEPYKSGLITEDFFKSTILPALSTHAPQSKLTVETSTTTIIHILRWKDSAHTTSAFEKWYLYDPNKKHYSFELQTKAQVFQRTSIPGTKHLQILYIHINSDLSDPTEDIQDGTPPVLKNPVVYTVAVTKQQTQLVKDLKSLGTLLGWTSGTGTAGAGGQSDNASAVYGYWSISTVDSAYATAQIVVTASLNTKDTQGTTANAPASAKGKSTDTTGQLSSKTYTSEKPAYFGLGFAIPVTSYKEITYNSTSSTLAPSTASKATVAVTGDLYLPGAQPTLTSFRYIPHLFFGLPIKGKVLQHTMLGAGVGLHWLSPYAAVVFDTNYGATTGATPKPGHLVMKGAFGLEVSVSSAVALLKSK